MATQAKRRDTNTLAFDIVQQATAEKLSDGKSPAAVALGRLGGLKGGPARAARLSSEDRRRIAKGAADKRWAAKLS
jgi:hypothetical protein